MLGRGTTPTFTYTFKKVPVEDIAVCFLTVKEDTVKVERDLTTATVGEDTIEWTLTQEETLKFKDKVAYQIRWKTVDGKTGKSPITTDKVTDILKEGVI